MSPVREWLSLYGRSLLLGIASLWRAFSVLVGVGVYGLIVWAAGLAAPIAVAAGVVLGVLLAGQLGALRLAHSAEREVAQWRRRPVSQDHALELRHALRSVFTDMDAQRPIHYGDSPGGNPLRQNMIRAHFPEVAARLDEWDVAATRLVDTRAALRAALDRQATTWGLNGPPYFRESLVSQIAGFTAERAVRGELDQPLELAINRGGVWTNRALVGLEMRGATVIDMSGIEDDEYADRAQRLMTPVNGLISAAQGWPATREITNALDALVRAEPAVRNAIHARLVREQIFVAASCPACGEQERPQQRG